MEILYLIFLLFIITFLTTIMITGIFLLIRAYKTKLFNLVYAGMSWLLMGISNIGLVLFKINIVYSSIFGLTSFVLFVVFTNSTFHKEQKSLLPEVILITAILLAAFTWYLNLLRVLWNNPIEIYTAKSIIDCIFRLIVMNWMARSSYKVYKEIKEHDIEPWIKVRYKILYIFSPLLGLYAFVVMFQPWNVQFGDSNNLQSYIVFGIVAIIAIVFSIAFLLAWLMPSKFKNYLNKGYEPLESKEYSQEEIIEIFKYLGDNIAEKIGMTPTATRGLIKLAVKDGVDPFKPMNQINYGNLKTVIKKDLKERLIKLDVQNVESIIDHTLNQLKNGQSLITMANI